MRVLRANVMGLCFGVRDALEIVDGISEPDSVTILGQLVHNEVVLADLRARGFTVQSESSPPVASSIRDNQILITAHGISDRERSRLIALGANLIDTTCPLVARVHEAAKALQAEGYHVLLIGRKQHVEVRGIVEDLDSVDVIEAESDVIDFGRDRLGIICQTTTPEHHASTLRAAITERNPNAGIRYIDTICLPTKEHQRSLDRLMAQVDAVVVVGGKNSNNTRELVKLCHEKGRPAFHVQTAIDVEPDLLKDFDIVGLTAGTSTLDRTIEEVYQALLAIAPRSQQGWRTTSPEIPLTSKWMNG